MPTKTVGYARLSTADQAKGLTLDQQVSRLKEAGAEEVLVDLMTGRSAARPKYRELLKRIDAGTVQKVIATRWDRMARSASETCRMVDLLCVDGAPELCLLDDPQDLSTIGGRAQLRMLGVFAQMESERIRERSAAGKAYRKAKGLLDVAPFGMEVNAGLLRPDKRLFLSELVTHKTLTRADLLLEAFDASAAAGSMHAPWIHLGETYGVWLDRTGMRRLLLNPALRGAKVGKRDKTNATWADVEEGTGGEPLIDPTEHLKYEAFIRVQMAGRNSPDKRKRHVLAGKVICDHCGSLMGRGTISKSAAGRFFCRNQDCSWLIPKERRNGLMEARLLSDVLYAMAAKAPVIAAVMEAQAQLRDETSLHAPELKKLQAKRQNYLQLLADGDPVQPVIDTIDGQIAALLSAGPSDGGGHLLQLRESALMMQRVLGVFPRGGGAMVPMSKVQVSSEEAAVSQALKESWERTAARAAEVGEAAIPPGPWDEIRELLKAAVIHDRALVRIELNI